MPGSDQLVHRALLVGPHPRSRSVRRPDLEDLDRVDALYFTVTVFATVGFGDITPGMQNARAVVLGQMVANLAVLGLLLRLVTGAVRINRGRRTGADQHG